MALSELDEERVRRIAHEGGPRFRAIGVAGSGANTTAEVARASARQLASGEAIMDPSHPHSNVASLGASGTLNLTGFRALNTRGYTQVRIFTGTTAAAATPTLARIGLYSIAADGTATLEAATANDTALFNAANTAFTKTLSSTFNAVAGNNYALGVIVVSGAAVPSFIGVAQSTSAGFLASLLGAAPKASSVFAGQTDLPASISNANQTPSALNIQAVLLP
jgi:hypothetical protein